MASDQQTPGGGQVAKPPQGRRAIARARRRAAFARGWRQFRTHRAGMLGLGILVFFIIAAILAPVLFPPDTISVTRATGELLDPPSGSSGWAPTTRGAPCWLCWRGGRGCP